MKELNLNFDAEFASEVLTEIHPQSYINKRVAGCGLTTVAIENKLDTIILVPNNELIYNKYSQYPNKRCNHRIIMVEAGVTRSDINYQISRCKIDNLPIKIMSTYDSISRIEYLLSKDVRIIVDESDKIIEYAKLKATDKRIKKDVMNTMLDILEVYKEKVSFISATPIPVEYLPLWVQGLDQINYYWNDIKRATPLLMKRGYVVNSLKREIILPLKVDGILHIGNATTNKIIIFYNSVSKSVELARSCGLRKSEVSFICSDNIQNDSKLRGYSRVKDYSKLPKFTFVTSSGWSGIDLYDDTALNVIVSDINQGYQMVDLKTNLEQAISRNRVKSNPNYGKYVFIYNENIYEKTDNELLSMIAEKRESIQDNMDLWLIAKNEKLQRGFAELRDTTVYTNFDIDKQEYYINELVFNSDRYSILETAKAYKKGFILKDKQSVAIIIESPVIDTQKRFNDYKKLFDESDDKNNIDWDCLDNEIYKEMLLESYKRFGKTFSYNSSKIKLETDGDKLKEVTKIIHTTFNDTRDYDLKEVKDTLQNIYNKVGIKRKAKSTDLHEFFKEVRIKNSRGIKKAEIIKK